MISTGEFPESFSGNEKLETNEINPFYDVSTFQFYQSFPSLTKKSITEHED